MADGACAKPGRTWPSRAAGRKESKREQHFYRYYGPFREMADYGPVFCDVREPQAREQHKAVSCPDKILTAFCQLGALRMKARRVLIFTFDVNHAYIMAEATQTLSLENDTIHDPGDQLWMGYSVIPRDVACCEITVNLPSFAATDKAHGDQRESVFVVDDLTQHPDLKNRPYVTEFPNGRHYAGVPLTSAQGVNIGAYCVLDDKPREGISDRDVIFLRDMSHTVMAYLETIRTSSEREQNNQMVAGLGDFVRNAPDSHNKGVAATNLPLSKKNESRDTSRTVAYSIPEALINNVTTPPLEVPDLSQLGHPGEGISQEQRIPQSSFPGELSPMLKSEAFPAVDVLAQTPTRPPQDDRHRQPNTQGTDMAANDPLEARTMPHQPDPAANERSTYQRAAEIMCQSLRIDGVAFLDMSVGTFGGLVQSTDTTTESSSMTSDSGQELEDTHADKNKACSVLGSAEVFVSDDTVGPRVHQPANMLTESFVRRLLNRNPHGKIWTFGENLLTHDEDGFSTDSESVDGDASTQQTPVASERMSSRTQRRSDGERLQQAFPGARCIALHGIWDHARRRWTVASFYWTFDPLRVLSPETEMHFVTAFSDIIEAETRRLEVFISDKAKSDFISSVSHELRSPLHGILGSVEILMGAKFDNATATLVEQIDTCGHSLLEIIDHLLDFSNLRNQNLTKGAVKSSKIGRKFLPSAADVPEDDLSAVKTGVALDDLTEDAVVSSVYSFYYDHNSKDRIQTSVILDIERSDNVAWRCQLATGGWRRVVINLVTNALKYTPAGYVRVSLRRKVKPGSRRRFDAVLSVTDSGKGMSREFQKNHLFQDFSQEDTLSNGLGLGLHMVSRMVSAMGGTVDVTSDQHGSGTRIAVTVPLEHHSDFRVPEDKGSAPLFKALAGQLKVGVVTVEQHVPLTRNDRLTVTSWSMAIASVEKNLEFLGLHPERCNLRQGNSYDLKVVLDIDLTSCLQALRDDASEVTYRDFAPMLVICHNSPSAQKLRRAWPDDNLSTKVAVEFIALPCGVKQMARAVAFARELYGDLNNPTSKQSQTEVTASGPTTDEVSHNLKAEDHSPEQPTTYHKNAHDHPKTNPTNLDSLLPSNEPSSHDRLPPLPKSLTHLPRNRASTLQDLTNDPPQVQRPTSDSSIPPATSIVDGPILLLVDDNKINLQLLVAFAKKNKYRHLTALDGKLALDAFETSHRQSLESVDSGEANTIPTVILMDINMPVMDGYEAVQRIRAYESKHQMTPAKVIAVTALQSEAAQAEAFGSGFDMFLSKPIKLKSLAKLILGG